MFEKIKKLTIIVRYLIYNIVLILKIFVNIFVDNCLINFYDTFFSLL